MSRLLTTSPAITKTLCRARLIYGPAQCLAVRVAVHGFCFNRRYATETTSGPTVKEKIEKMAAESPTVDQRIYFLGMGAIGKLIAYSFADIPEAPPITLMFSSKALCSDFLSNDGTLEYTRNGLSDLRRGYDAEYSSIARPDLDTRPMIDNLVVVTKAPFTAKALLSIKHRLGSESTIVLLQNGMGLVEELNEHVFPDIQTRPHYILGVVSHGAINRDHFVVDHTAIGNIALTAPPKVRYEGESELESPVTLLAPSTRHLLRTFTRTPLLGSIALSPKDHLLIQLEKLAGNCIINPLTAILGCRNGELTKTSSLVLVRLLLAEISLVIRSLPELKHIPGIGNRFSPATLEYNVRKLMTSTRKNTSSMLQDMMKGQKTEIDYMNGYIFRRGEEIGIRSMVNFTVKTMVDSKSLIARDGDEHLTIAGGNEADLDSAR